MRLLKSSPILATAFALFAMLFGSGNIAFPLGLGRDLGSMAVYGMIGFFITAIAVPVLGIIAMSLYNGDYRLFLSRIGKIPGAFVIFICLALMGPFCIIPRCIALSHLALQFIMPSLTLLQFSLFAAVIIFLATYRESGVIGLMSRVLGPIKFILLSAIIAIGFFASSTVIPCSLSSWTTFAQGLFVGYGTLDLLAVMFFSQLLLSGLRYDERGRERTQSSMMRLLVIAGIIGAIMLGVMYAGFVLVASMQSGIASCIQAEEGQLLSILAALLLGSGGGVLASITMAIACSTTAIALTTVFADYLNEQLFKKRSYHGALLITLAIAVFFANFGFAGIKALIAPVIEILYPALIVLALTNILYKTIRIDCSKFPFYATLGCTVLWRIWPLLTR